MYAALNPTDTWCSRFWGTFLPFYDNTMCYTRKTNIYISLIYCTLLCDIYTNVQWTSWLQSVIIFKLYEVKVYDLCSINTRYLMQMMKHQTERYATSAFLIELHVDPLNGCFHLLQFCLEVLFEIYCIFQSKNKTHFLFSIIWFEMSNILQIIWNLHKTLTEMLSIIFF